MSGTVAALFSQSAGVSLSSELSESDSELIVLVRARSAIPSNVVGPAGYAVCGPSCLFSAPTGSVVRLSVGLPELVLERALKLKSDLSNGLCAVFVCCVTLIASSLTCPHPIR